ncbi:MAG: hypothetical protein ACE5H1_11160 [Thermodesulfobacteriota bacterium]
MRNVGYSIVYSLVFGLLVATAGFVFGMKVAVLDNSISPQNILISVYKSGELVAIWRPDNIPSMLSDKGPQVWDYDIKIEEIKK